MLKQRRNFRTETERQANRFATSASRSNIRYSLSETHATPDGHTVKQIGEHTWLIEKAGIVVHRCQRNPFTRPDSRITQLWQRLSRNHGVSSTETRNTSTAM